jgi:hypothetical protein
VVRDTRIEHGQTRRRGTIGRVLLVDELEKSIQRLPTLRPLTTMADLTIRPTVQPDRAQDPETAALIAAVTVPIRRMRYPFAYLADLARTAWGFRVEAAPLLVGLGFLQGVVLWNRWADEPVTDLAGAGDRFTELGLVTMLTGTTSARSSASVGGIDPR